VILYVLRGSGFFLSIIANPRCTVFAAVTIAALDSALHPGSE
jgi:hypothetical protein